MIITGTLIAIDIFWIIVMRSTWASKPFNNHTGWAVFDFLRTFTLIASAVNVGVKGFIMALLGRFYATAGF